MIRRNWEEHAEEGDWGLTDSMKVRLWLCLWTVSLGRYVSLSLPFSGPAPFPLASQEKQQYKPKRGREGKGEGG